MTTEQGRERPGDLERAARGAFDASVDRLDAATCERLAQARGRAVAAAAVSAPGVPGTRRWPARGWSMTALAASVAFVALLLAPQWRTADDAAPGVATPLPGAMAQQDAVELLEASDDELQIVVAREELEFYAWVDLAGRG